jgi:ankyrin repeat protein
MYPFWSACSSGRTATVAEMLLSGADLSDRHGISPLWIACRYGHTTIVEMVLKHVGHMKLSRGVSPFWVACRFGHTATVILLLKYGADVHQVDNTGKSPLWIVCKYGHTATATVLLQYNADVGQLDTVRGASPLWIACRYGHTATVAEILLTADIGQTDKVHGESPLCTACKYGYITTVELLLQRGANVEQTDHSGRSPLFITCRNGHTAIIPILLKRNAGQQTNQSGYSPLWVACRVGDESSAYLLASYGASTNGILEHLPHVVGTLQNWLKVSTNWSALHHACFANLPLRVVELLIAGADERVSSESVTPLQLAQHVSVQQLLQRAMLPWSPKEQFLFPPIMRRQAMVLMLVHHRLCHGRKRRRTVLPELPRAIWLLVIGFVIRRCEVEMVRALGF